MREAKTIRQLRASAIFDLAEAWGKPSSDPVLRLDADVLLQHSLNLTRAELITRADTPLDAHASKIFLELVDRRKRFEPIAYLIGRKEFFGYDFAVSPDVLIPRPETEVIVERALQVILQESVKTVSSKFFIVDVGVGSGAILLSVLKSLESVAGDIANTRICSAVGIDLSEAALAMARENADRLAVKTPVKFVKADLLQPLFQSAPADAAIFCLLLSNPPYIADGESLMPDVRNYEPALALFGGREGYEVSEQLISQAAKILSRHRGVLLLEIGQGQADRLVSSAPAGLRCNARHRDLSDIERVLEFSSGREDSQAK